MTGKQSALDGGNMMSWKLKFQQQNEIWTKVEGEGRGRQGKARQSWPNEPIRRSYRKRLRIVGLSKSWHGSWKADT